MATTGLTLKREVIRWWANDGARLQRLQGFAFDDDPALRRLDASDIGALNDLRILVRTIAVSAEDLLAYQTYADGTFGRYRVVAAFPLPPNIDPLVLCLDGPRGEAASPHRNGETALCLYHPDDPPERRWTELKGLQTLYAMARQHLAAEDIWRTDHVWVLDEAPHGQTPGVAPPGRNDPCTCGSRRKAKRCCWQ
jgi:hypothetical protein